MDAVLTFLFKYSSRVWERGDVVLSPVAPIWLIAALAPGRLPETCEVDYVVDAQGMMVAVLVRDLSTGEVIARINAEDLWQLGTEEAAGGLLLERRG